MKRKKPPPPEPLQTIEVGGTGPTLRPELRSQNAMTMAEFKAALAKRPPHRSRTPEEIAYALLYPALRVKELQEHCGRSRYNAKRQVMAELDISMRKVETSLAFCRQTRKR